MKKNRSKHWEQCPRCGGARTYFRSKAALFWGGLIVAVLSIPWVLIIVGILPLVAGLALAIAAPFMRSVMVCRTCKFKWEKKAVPAPTRTRTTHAERMVQFRKPPR